MQDKQFMKVSGINCEEKDESLKATKIRIQILSSKDSSGSPRACYTLSAILILGTQLRENSLTMNATRNLFDMMLYRIGLIVVDT